MDAKTFTCIECPLGCRIGVDYEDCKVIKAEGNKCPKGLKYVSDEIANPTRILTSTVPAEGLSLRMVPVRTNGAVPKARMFEIMNEIRKVRITGRVKSGDVIVKDILGLGVDLVATRSVE